MIAAGVEEKKALDSLVAARKEHAAAEKKAVAEHAKAADKADKFGY